MKSEELLAVFAERGLSDPTCAEGLAKRFADYLEARHESLAPGDLAFFIRIGAQLMIRGVEDAWNGPASERTCRSNHAAAKDMKRNWLRDASAPLHALDQDQDQDQDRDSRNTERTRGVDDTALAGEGANDILFDVWGMPMFAEHMRLAGSLPYAIETTTDAADEDESGATDRFEAAQARITNSAANAAWGFFEKPHDAAMITLSRSWRATAQDAADALQRARNELASVRRELTNARDVRGVRGSY